MSTPEERRKKAEYMRGWHRSNSRRLSAEKRSRYADDDAYREAFRTRARMTNLRKRGGVDADTESFVETLLQDPCAYCGEPMTLPTNVVDRQRRTDPRAAGLDHIEPHGDSHWTNLAGACSACNSSKGQLSSLLALLDRRLRAEVAPIAEQIWLLKGGKTNRSYIRVHPRRFEVA